MGEQCSMFQIRKLQEPTKMTLRTKGWRLAEAPSLCIY